MQGLFPGICPQSFKTLWTFFRFSGKSAVGPPLPGWPLRHDHQKDQVKISTSLRGAKRRTPGWLLLPYGQFTFWQSPGTSYRFRDFSRRFPRGCAPRNDRWEDRADSPRCMPQIGFYCLPPQSWSHALHGSMTAPPRLRAGEPWVRHLAFTPLHIGKL